MKKPSLNRIFPRPRTALLGFLLAFFVLWAVPAAAQDGTIRVLLTALRLTDRADLTLDGSYTCAGMSFQQGSRVTLQLRDGSIFLFYEGLTRDMGQEAVFTRHALDRRPLNGIRVNGAYNLYTGDLIFGIQDGQMTCVARLYVEEYLLGVLPYEMSSSFPLEALKAQAVAARSYALNSRSPSRPYDVVDNTNDQVYQGITSDPAVIRQAVTETAGVCVLDGDQPARCYYTASNGGLAESVENVWGTAGSGYIRRRTDSYDLNNPESPVLTLILPKDWEKTAPPDGLRDVLIPPLLAALEKRGYSPQPDEVRVQGIQKAALLDETYEGSGIYQTVGMEVLVSVPRSSRMDSDEEIDVTFDGVRPVLRTPPPEPEAQEDGWQKLNNPVSVSIPYFTALEGPMHLSLNGNNNERLTLREEEDQWVLEARRFGHGVGLSQRGAQWMAANARWGYRQILRFYYPGGTLKKLTLTDATAPALAEAFLATPAPPATPTPRPTLMPVSARKGEYLVTVNQISADSTLNLRREPNTTSDVLMRLYFGQKLAVLSQQGDWLCVRTDAVQGYVMQKYVTRDEPATEDTDE